MSARQPAVWTEVQDAALSILRADGLSIKEIALRLKRSDGVVARRCRILGIAGVIVVPPYLDRTGMTKKPPPPPEVPVVDHTLVARGHVERIKVRRTEEWSLDPLPSLQEPMYVIPVRVTEADVRPAPPSRSRSRPSRHQ